MPRNIIFTFADLELIESDGRYFVRYDVGSHQVVMREDEITEYEARQIQAGKNQMAEVLFSLQRRLIANGVNPYASNCPNA